MTVKNIGTLLVFLRHSAPYYLKTKFLLYSLLVWKTVEGLPIIPFVNCQKKKNGRETCKMVFWLEKNSYYTYNEVQV